MSPENFFFPFVFVFFFNAIPTATQEDGDLLTRIKTLDDPNELWNLLKTASRSKPPDEEEIEPDSEEEDFFGGVDDSSELFKSEENGNEVSTPNSLTPVKSFTDTPISLTSAFVTQNPATENSIQTIIPSEKITLKTPTATRSTATDEINTSASIPSTNTLDTNVTTPVSPSAFTETTITSTGSTSNIPTTTMPTTDNLSTSTTPSIFIENTETTLYTETTTDTPRKTTTSGTTSTIPRTSITTSTVIPNTSTESIITLSNTSTVSTSTFPSSTTNTISTKLSTTSIPSTDISSTSTETTTFIINKSTSTETGINNPSTFSEIASTSSAAPTIPFSMTYTEPNIPSTTTEAISVVSNSTIMSTTIMPNTTSQEEVSASNINAYTVTTTDISSSPTENTTATPSTTISTGTTSAIPRTSTKTTLNNSFTSTISSTIISSISTVTASTIPRTSPAPSTDISSTYAETTSDISNAPTGTTTNISSTVATTELPSITTTMKTFIAITNITTETTNTLPNISTTPSTDILSTSTENNTDILNEPIEKTTDISSRFAETSTGIPSTSSLITTSNITSKITETTSSIPSTSTKSTTDVVDPSKATSVTPSTITAIKFTSTTPSSTAETTGTAPSISTPPTINTTNTTPETTTTLPSTTTSTIPNLTTGILSTTPSTTAKVISSLTSTITTSATAKSSTNTETSTTTPSTTTGFTSTTPGTTSSSEAVSTSLGTFSTLATDMSSTSIVKTTAFPKSTPISETTSSIPSTFEETTSSIPRSTTDAISTFPNATAENTSTIPGTTVETTNSVARVSTISTTSISTAYTETTTSNLGTTTKPNSTLHNEFYLPETTSTKPNTSAKPTTIVLSTSSLETSSTTPRTSTLQNTPFTDISTTSPTVITNTIIPETSNTTQNTFAVPSSSAETTKTIQSTSTENISTIPRKPTTPAINIPSTSAGTTTSIPTIFTRSTNTSPSTSTVTYPFLPDTFTTPTSPILSTSEKATISVPSKPTIASTTSQRTFIVTTITPRVSSVSAKTIFSIPTTTSSVASKTFSQATVNPSTTTNKKTNRTTPRTPVTTAKTKSPKFMSAITPKSPTTTVKKTTTKNPVSVVTKKTLLHTNNAPTLSSEKTTAKNLPTVSMVTPNSLTGKTPTPVATRSATTARHHTTTKQPPTTKKITPPTKIPRTVTTKKIMSNARTTTKKKLTTPKTQRTPFSEIIPTKKPLTTNSSTRNSTKTLPSTTKITTTKKPYDLLPPPPLPPLPPPPLSPLPPPPLPPLPPPPLPPLPPQSCKQCATQTTTQRSRAFQPFNPCSNSPSCNEQYYPKPIASYNPIHVLTTTTRPEKNDESPHGTKSLDPGRTFLIADTPKENQPKSPNIQTKESPSLLLDRKFIIPLNDSNTRPKSSTSVSPSTETSGFSNNPNMNYPNFYHSRSCSSCGQNVPPNHPMPYNPRLPESNRNIPSSPHSIPTSILPLPNHLDNRFGIVLSQENPTAHIPKTTSTVGINHSKGTIPVVPVLLERRIISNPSLNYHPPDNSRSRVNYPTPHIFPILISKQEQQQKNKETHSFIKPTFDFIISNVSNTPDGQFQIKPVARNPESRKLYVHFNGNKPFNMHPNEQHSQGPNVVFLVKNQQHPFNTQHPSSAGEYRPINNVPQDLPFTITFRRSKRNVAEEEWEETQGTSLTFVFDTTGSMSTELHQVQSQATALARAMTLHPDKPIYNYVFVPFNDPEVGPAKITRDYAYFQRILDRVQVNGGGDCPEMSMTGLIEAIEKSKPRSFVYVFTDAGAKDGHLKDEVLKMIQKKKPIIVFLVTGFCDKEEDLKFYKTITTISGGDVYDLDRTSINEVLEFMKKHLNNRQVNLISVDLPHAAPVPKPYTMPVDELVDEITVSVSGVRPVLNVYDPSGNIPKPSKLHTILNISTVKVVNVKEPEPGPWRIEVGSGSAHSIRSTALSKSNIKFAYGFSVIPTTNLAETAHRPLQGTNNSLLVKTYLPSTICNLTQMKLIDFNGKLIGTIIPLTPIDEQNGLYSGGPILPPNNYFNMEVQGYDSNGNKLVRLFPSAIKPQMPDIPDIIVKPHVFAISGGNINLECHVESLVPVKVRWYKGRQLLATFEYKQSAKSVFPIADVSLDTAGNYTCWTKNIAGALTKNIIVSIADPPKIIVPPEARYEVNTPGKLECLVQNSLPYNVTWSKQITNRDKPGEVHLASWHKSPETGDSGYSRNDYIINEVTLEDEGKYICTVYSKGATVKGEVNLVILGPPSLEELTQIKFTNKASLVVTCKLSRYDPSITMFWEKKDSPINTNHTTIDGNVHNNFTFQLIIYKPDKRDEGFYRCVASNSFGNEIRTVKVSYISEPKIKADEEEVLVKLDTSARLKCILSDGIPIASITWMKQGIEITNDLPNLIVTEDGSELIISNVREVDATQYRCTARNEAGVDSASVNLLLASEPKILTPASNRRVELDYGGSLEIPCKATGKPPPCITWTKVSSGVGALNEHDEDALKLHEATLEDEGEYVCEAKNSFGMEQVTIKIAIIGLEEPTINGREVVTKVKGLVGQKVELPCVLLSGNPIPNTTWYKDGIRLAPSMYNNIVLSNGSFIIHVLTLRHVGNYECRVQNVVGQDKKEYSLSTYDAPKMNMSLGSFILTKVGSNVTLPCHIRGDPQPVVTWYKENDSPDRPNRGFRVNGSDNFFLLKVAEEDSGRYICKGENIAGTARRAVILSVISVPKILNFPQELSAISGDIVFISCQTQGSPRPTIRWLKGGQPLLHVRGSIGSNYLRFFADASDTGEYTCIAENKAGEDRASTFLMILEPPKIDQNSDNHIEGVLGENIELPCQVSGTPRPFVQWQHKGQTIKKIIPSADLAIGLHISNLTEEHKGQYICIASNKAGTARKSVELSVLIPPRIDEWDDPIKVAPGDTVTISCRVSGTPKPTVKWIKNGHNLPPEFFSYDNILRFIVESSHSGNYTCIAGNKAGNDSKDVEISVYEAPKFLLDQSEDLEILQRSDVEILCSAIGDPMPTIHWFYNGRILGNKHNVRFFQDKDIILISEVGEEDEGIYECTATNKAGSNSRSIKINVLVAPNVTKWSDDLSVKEGNEVILNCDVNGKPEPMVVWKKNGVPLPSDLSYRGNKIRFIATALDHGNYSCHASNKVGNDVKYTHLTVKVHPQILGEQELEIVALLGDGLELKCEAKGVPSPVISWMLNSTLLNSLPNAAFKLKGSNLVIPKVEFHNEGIYICSASNSLGTVQKQIQVKVHVPPSINDDSPTAILLREGEDFSISCSSYGVPNPDIFWIKSDKIFKRGYHDEHYVVMNDHTLILSNAQFNMSGNYFCVSTNIEGSAMKNYSIEVTVPPKDHFHGIGNLTLVEIEESDDGVLNCPLPSNSPVSWLKDDEAIDLSGNDRADDVHLQLLEGGHTLMVAEAYSSDTGVYTCYTDEGQTSQFFVQVLAKPHFVQEFLEMDFELKQGDQLSLDCSAEGNPTPKINWRHLEKNIPITRHTVPGVLVKGEEKDILYFPAVKIHHAGRYMCIASNKVGREGRIFTVKVTEPPMLIGEREQKITAVAGNALDLNCTVNGSPKPKITWKHISPKGEEILLHYNEKMLMINNLSPDNGGIYICNGTNKVGSAVKYFFIFILEAPEIKGGNFEEIKLPEGKEMELECMASGVPLPSLTWQLDSRPIDTTRTIITSTKPQSNGTLTSTLRIKTVDPSVAGIYTCFASNTVGTSQKHFGLSIIMPPILLDKSFLVTNKSVDVNEGQAIYLTCPVRESQDIDVNWFVIVNGKSQSIEKQSNGKLYIPSAQTNDGGVYTCTASNSAGKIDASFAINISVPPVFVASTYEWSVTLNQDDELILNCSVNSTPLSQIVWLKDGTRITGKRNINISLINHNQTLIISDIKASDSGKYICIASNTAGSVERSFQVNIHEAPKIDGTMSGQISMVTNKTEAHFSRVILRCPLTGSPQPTIEWFKEGLLLTENERVYVTPQRTKVIIFYLTEEDAGYYTCRAQNQAGINQLFFNVHLIVPLEWTQWTNWSNCSKNCDSGQQYRNRTCGEEPPLKYKYSPYIQYDTTACKGEKDEVRTCNTHACKVDGEWGGWSEWSSCSASCGEGTKSRSRRCNNPAPSFGGSRCKGPNVGTSSCFRPPCPVNGQWSGWSEWSECTVSCGGGLKFRERRCNSPAPKDGGKPCPGSYRDVIICNQHKCPIDGRWSTWGRWSNCSAACGTGTQTRNRHCYRPMYGGRPCLGVNKEVKYCQSPPCDDNEAYSEALHIPVVRRDLPEIETAVSDYSNHSSSEKEYTLKRVPDSESEHRLSVPAHLQRNGIVYLTGRAKTFVEKEDLISWSKRDQEDRFDSSIKSSQVDNNQNNGVQIIKDENGFEKSLDENSELSTYDSSALMNSDEVHTYFKSIKCPAGFRHNKTTYHCQDVNECRHKKWNRCHRSRNICVNTIGSYKCLCAPGYRLTEVGLRKRCIDINECKEDLSSCSHFCHNTKGGYRCSCPDGLTLLQDIHTCVKDSSSSDDYESGDKTLSDEYLGKDSEPITELKVSSELPVYEPGYQLDSQGVHGNDSLIICPKGFIVDGKSCKDINECSLDLDDCTPEQVCINTLGYYKCYDAPCPLDYELLPSIRSCQRNCSSNELKCTLARKAETITYETFDTENKTISSFEDIVLLIAYNQNKGILNSTVYTVSDKEDLPVDVRKENNLGILYATTDFYIKDMKRIDIVGITREKETKDVLYESQFIVFIYNSFTIN